jgi:hypothetical protein
MSESYLPVAGWVNSRKYLYRLLMARSADVTPVPGRPATLLRFTL